MAERVQLNEQDIENVVGGAFNWYTDNDGNVFCRVDGFRTYKATTSAQNKLMRLMVTHKKDGWTAKDYVDALCEGGYFS